MNASHIISFFDDICSLCLPLLVHTLSLHSASRRCRRINEESAEEALLTTVQRVFKSVDTDECGFIMEERLPEVLEMLGIPEAADTDWLVR